MANNSYGYNGKGCRNNILLLPSQEILYFVAKVSNTRRVHFQPYLIVTFECVTPIKEKDFVTFNKRLRPILKLQH